MSFSSFMKFYLAYNSELTNVFPFTNLKMSFLLKRKQKGEMEEIFGLMVKTPCPMSGCQGLAPGSGTGS